jgi:hypothetical protein
MGNWEDNYYYNNAQPMVNMSLDEIIEDAKARLAIAKPPFVVRIYDKNGNLVFSDDK